jgi:lactate dehydrogenase-like 2-hydroxyacid dehydrogenase
MYRPKLLLTRVWPDEVLHRLHDRYEVSYDPSDRTMTRSELQSAMRSFDILCPTVSDRIDAETLSVADRTVQLLANYGAGTDHLDLAAATTAGLPVSNTPDVLTEATAEIALLLMLMTARRAGEGERELRVGAWQGWRPTHLLGRSLAGKQLGLVGFGRIGQATARLAARSLGMEIAYFTRRRAAGEVEAETGARFVDTLNALAETSDVLSLHCGGGPETRRLIDARVLARMKPGAILINTARGTIVDEAALAAALVTGPIGGAGLDVYEREPLVDPGLLSLPNVVLLPHLGSATIETRTAMGMRVADNIDQFIYDGSLLDRVA